jgi:hypothetical protein
LSSINKIPVGVGVDHFPDLVLMLVIALVVFKVGSGVGSAFGL